jgi:hypothetical protein
LLFIHLFWWLLGFELRASLPPPSR